MWTIGQFKAENGVQSLDLMQKNGRMFCSLRDKSVIVAENCDMKKPLFVVPVKEDKDGNPLVNVFAICNSEAKVVATV